MQNQSIPLTDQIANVSPVVIVLIVLFSTVIRLALARIHRTEARIISEVCDTINFVLILAYLLIRPFVGQAFYIPSESMEQTLLKEDRLIVDKFSYRLGEPQRGDVVVFNAPPAATGGIEGIDYIKRLIAVGGDTIQVKRAELKIGDEIIEPAQLSLNNVHEFLRSRLGLGGEVALKIYPDHILIDGKERITAKELAEKLGEPDKKITLTPGRVIRNGKVLDEPYTREDPDYDYPDAGGPTPFLKIDDGKLFMMGDNRNRSEDSHVWHQLDRKRVVGKARVIFLPFNRWKAIQ